jgi:hypothetical protein
MSEQQVVIPVGKSPSNLVAGMSVLRADDFISLEFEFIKLAVSMPSPGKPALTIVNPAHPAYIIVTFPPQSIAGQAFWLAADTFRVPPAPVNRRIMAVMAEFNRHPVVHTWSYRLDQVA